MLLEAVYHRPRLNWSYAYDENAYYSSPSTRQKGDLTEVFAWVGDKYAWDHTKKLIPMTLFTSDDMFDYWGCTHGPSTSPTKIWIPAAKGSRTDLDDRKRFPNHPACECKQIIRVPLY